MLTITGTTVTLDVAASRVAALTLKQVILHSGWDTKWPDEPAIAGEARQLLAATLEDRVLVASDGTASAVIAYEGGLALDYEADGGGRGALLDHMGEPPGPGLWLYAGKMKITGYRSYEGDYDEDVDFSGDYRRVTEDDLRTPGRLLYEWDGMWVGDAEEEGLDVTAIRAAQKVAAEATAP